MYIAKCEKCKTAKLVKWKVSKNKIFQNVNMFPDNECYMRYKNHSE